VRARKETLQCKPRAENMKLGKTLGAVNLRRGEKNTGIIKGAKEGLNESSIPSFCVEIRRTKKRTGHKAGERSLKAKK